MDSTQTKQEIKRKYIQNKIRAKISRSRTIRLNTKQ